MGTQSKWDAVLPWEADWDALLPNHDWKPHRGINWQDAMPPPRRQLGILSGDFGGSCGIHAFSDTLTGLLRIGFPASTIEVDLPRLLHLSAAKGVLTQAGSTMKWLDLLARRYGIPLEGTIAEPHMSKEEFGLSQLNADADIYALGTSILSLLSYPMPSSPRSRTAAKAKLAIEYRERLCDLLDLGPLMICFDVDDRYMEPRELGQPYCRVPDPWLTFGDPPKSGHCVTAYAYRCPGGDVRTLRILYQENDAAPGQEPGRMVMHPDAIDSYHVVRLKDLQFANAPSQGYQDVEQHHPSPETPSWWKKAIDRIF